MTTELTMLALSIVLGLVQITIAAQASTRQRGADWNVGPRDEALPPLAGTAGGSTGRCGTSSRPFRCSPPPC